MKKIKILAIFVLGCTVLKAQDQQQFVLQENVALQSALGNNYHRVALSNEDLRVADSLVALFLPANYRHYDWSRKITDYYDYYRQYAGFSDSSSGKVLFINGYRRKKAAGKTDPTETLVSYKGGGSDFFSIKINLLTYTCYDLRVNSSK